MNCTAVFKNVVKAGQTLNLLDDIMVSKVLRLVAEAAENNSDYIISENMKDLSRMEESDPRYDRLLLSHQRLQTIASEIRRVAEMDSPLGRVLSGTERPNGLKIKRISVPFGVIGIIYEARPNVTFDVFSLCFK